MDYYIFLYYFAGILQDFLLTLNWRFIANGKKVQASILSFLVTIVSMTVLYNILTRLDTQRSVTAILIYAAGIATGTFLGMKFKWGLDDKK